MKRIGVLAVAALFLAACGEKAPLQNGDYLVYSIVTSGSTSGEGVGGKGAVTANLVRLDFQEGSGGWSVTLNEQGSTSTMDVPKSLKGLAPASVGQVWLPSGQRANGKKALGGKVVGTKKKWMGHECIVIKHEENWLRLYDKETGLLIWVASGQIAGLDPRPIGGSTVKLAERRVGGVEWKSPI